MPACVFCRIVGDADPDVLVHLDDDVAAFLDRRPLFPGHLLVVPREHVETLDGVPADLLRPLFTVVQAAMRSIERELGAAGTFVASNNRVSQSVPHLHVHVVPRRPRDGLRGFFWPRTSYDDDAHEARVRGLLRRGIAAELGTRPGPPGARGG